MRTVISCRRAALCAAIVVCLIRAAHATEGLTIPSFSADITVNPNGTLTVEEQFTTRVQVLRFFGDIGRNLPISTRDRWDAHYVQPAGKAMLTAKLEHVYRDGVPIVATTDFRNGYANIRLGYIPHGDHHYRILYTVSGAIDFASRRGASDLLYWNALGHDWHYTVDEASVAVHLPASIAGEDISSEAYSGQRGQPGSAGTDLMPGDQTPGDHIHGTRSYSQHNLAPRESLTIVVKWPTGVIENHIYDTLKKILILPFALLAYYVVTWLLVARRPKAGAIVAQYTPPSSMTPAEMRYLRAGMSDQKSVAAVVAHLAARKLIAVQPQGNEYMITRLVDELSADLPDEERAAFRSMFMVGTDVTNPMSFKGVYRMSDDMTLGKAFRLCPSQGNKVAAIQAAIARSLDGRVGSSYFKRNFEYSVPAVVLSSSLAIGMAASFGHPDGLFPTLWFLFCATVLGVLMALKGIPALRDMFRGRLGAGNLPLTMAPLLIFGIVLVSIARNIARATDPAFAGSLVAIVVLNVVFPLLLQTPTTLGRERMDQVEGFRQFLATVELDSIDRLNNPHWTPTLKIDFLAYAIALDLKEAWGDHLVSAMFNTVATGK